MRDNYALRQEVGVLTLSGVIRNVTRPVRLGIAGCGNVLGAYLTSAAQLRREGLADVVGLCGRDRQRDAALDRWPTAAFVTDYSSLLSCEDIAGRMLTVRQKVT